MQGFDLGLTFAGRDALKPLVMSVPVAGNSAVLEPSTTRSATTASAGFFERAALWARHLISRCNALCADCRARYFQLPFN